VAPEEVAKTCELSDFFNCSWCFYFFKSFELVYTSCVSLKPRYSMLVAPNSHFGNFAFKPTFLSLGKCFSNCIKCFNDFLSVLVDPQCIQ
jgi:hypothetical protein